MGDDGIAVGGGFSLVVAVDAASMTVTLAMPATGPMCAAAPPQHTLGADEQRRIRAVKPWLLWMCSPRFSQMPNPYEPDAWLVFQAMLVQGGTCM